jgi:hypothetical protein
MKTSISEEQRKEFTQLASAAISQIEARPNSLPTLQFVFLKTAVFSCSQLGLRLEDQKLIESDLTRTSGGNDLAWLDDLVD